MMAQVVSKTWESVRTEIRILYSDVIEIKNMVGEIYLKGKIRSE